MTETISTPPAEPIEYDKLTPELEVRVANAKLAFFDIDQTLVVKNSEDGPSQPVRDAVSALGELIPVGLVSARPKVKAETIMGQIEFNGFSIFSDGAQIWNHETEEYEIERVIDKEFMKKIIPDLQGRGIVYWIQDNGVDHVLNGFDRLTKNSGTGKESSSPEGYTQDKPFVVVAHAVSMEESENIINRVQEMRFANVEARRGDMHDDNSYDVFISDSKSNKKDALAYVAEKRGITANEIIGFGDGLNDRKLMEGCTGIAMGNAHQDTLAVATIVIPSVSDDGVATFINVVALPLIRASRTQAS